VRQVGQLPRIIAYCTVNKTLKRQDNFSSTWTRQSKWRNLFVYPTRKAMYYNVTLRRFRATIVAVEKQYVLHIVTVRV